MTACRIHGNPSRDYAAEWKQWRKANGMTQEQLAIALGMSEVAIWYIENGYRRPSVTSRAKFKALQNKYQEERAWQTR